MKRMAAILLALFAGLSTHGQSPNTPLIYEFKNGNWFEGRTFVTVTSIQSLGQLKPGYEASFLVLHDNPLKYFSAIKNIESRFKQGRVDKPLRAEGRHA